MSENEKLVLKMNILGGMNEYVREAIGDDDLTDIWNMEGIPDGADEDILKEIAEDEEAFTYICREFFHVVKYNHKFN